MIPGMSSKVRLGIVTVCVAVVAVAYWLSDEPRPFVKSPATTPSVSFPAESVTPKPDAKTTEERERIVKEITEKMKEREKEGGTAQRVPPVAP